LLFLPRHPNADYDLLAVSSLSLHNLIVMTRKKNLKVTAEIPPWVQETDNACLQSVAEDVYVAQGLARAHGAHLDPSCKQLVAAASKSMKIMENVRASDKKRCDAGERAARKFWEAKVCARK